MHRGCFVCTPTPPLSGRRTPRPGPVRVCACVLYLARSGQPASQARFGAPHFLLWPSMVRSWFVGPLRAGVALFVVVVGFFVFPCCAPVISGVPCFLARGALGLGVLLSSAPPRPFFCLFLFSFPFFFLVCRLRVVFCGFRPVVPWALASCRPPCGGFRVWTRSLTRPVSRTVRLSTGDSVGAPGMFRVDADTAPFGSEDATPGSRACVRVRALFGRVGQAGLPGAFWCASLSPVAALGALLVCSAPLGWGCPVCGCCWVLIFFSLLRPRCPRQSLFSGPGCLGAWRLVVLRPPSAFFFVFFVFSFLFLFLVRRLVRGVLWIPARGAVGPGVVSSSLRWFSCVDPVTDASRFPYRPSFDGGLGRCTGAVSCGRRHRPIRVGGRHARVPCVCARACSSWQGRADRPPRRVLVRLTFSCGRPWCALGLFGPSGLGLPCSWLLLGFFPFPCCAPVVSGVPCFPARGALGLGVLLSSAPSAFFFFFLFFFSFLLRRLVRGVLWILTRGAVGLGVVSSSLR